MLFRFAFSNLTGLLALVTLGGHMAPVIAYKTEEKLISCSLTTGSWAYSFFSTCSYVVKN